MTKKPAVGQQTNGGQFQRADNEPAIVKQR